MPKTQRQIIGDIGERVSKMFLKKHGFKIVESNYLKKWGEIDIVAKKGNSWHFVEVKSVTRENKEGDNMGEIEPLENIHKDKLLRLKRTIESYILEKNIDENTPYQLDAISVVISRETEKASVKYIPNIYLED